MMAGECFSQNGNSREWGEWGLWGGWGEWGEAEVGGRNFAPDIHVGSKRPGGGLENTKISSSFAVS